LIWSGVDALTCPDVWAYLALFRLVVALPLVVLAAWLDLRHPPLRGRLQLAALIGLSVPTLALYQASYYPSVALSYLIFPLILVYVNLSLPT
ncbi:hypothetical protein J8J27_26700, partial [Mycobacterium tuberculosis]|nr:hypothetical protein [Mycobacterium tuberculosis]